MILIQINKLWSLEEYQPKYWFDMGSLSVINRDTGIPVKIHIDKRGYPVVYLARIFPTETGKTHKSVKLHKIIALSMINNGPYILIEHLDDNPLNWNPNNLKFSDHRANYHSMINNGIYHKNSSIFEVTMANGNTYTGDMKEISSESGIPKGTLYDRAYKGVPERSPRKHQIYMIKEISSGDGRRLDISNNKTDSNGNTILYYDERFDRSND